MDQVIWTLCDPRNGGHPQTLDFTPKIDGDFIWWQGELREIAAIHSNKTGNQIELVK